MVHLQMLYSQLEDQQIAPPTYSFRDDAPRFDDGLTDNSISL